MQNEKRMARGMHLIFARQGPTPYVRFGRYGRTIRFVLFL